MKNEEKYTLLILKKLSGEITQEQAAELDKWLSESEEHRQLYDKYKKAWEVSGEIDPEVFGIDIEKEWIRQRRMSIKSKGVVNIRSFYPYVAAAAAVLILFFALFSAIGNKTYEYYASTNRDLTMPDGTNIVLKRGSKLIFTSKYGKKDRKVTLEGDAYFNVTHNKELPFVVEAGNFEVIVRGTQFAVSQTKKEVLVKTGKVEVTTGDKRVIITDNQAVKIENNKIVPTEINDPNYLAWETGILKFENATLGEVVDILSDAYGKEVKLEDNSLKNLKITVTFDNQSLSSVVNVIAKTLNLKAEKRGDVYILKR